MVEEDSAKSVEGCFAKKSPTNNQISNINVFIEKDVGQKLFEKKMCFINFSVHSQQNNQKKNVLKNFQKFV